MTSRTSFLSSSDLSHEDPFAPEKSPVKGSWAISVGESMARKARLGDNLYERTFGSFFAENTAATSTGDRGLLVSWFRQNWPFSSEFSLL